MTLGKHVVAIGGLHDDEYAALKRLVHATPRNSMAEFLRMLILPTIHQEMRDPLR